MKEMKDAQIFLIYLFITLQLVPGGEMPDS